MMDEAPADDARAAPPTPLEAVVDDDTPLQEATDWAVDALYEDRDFDEVTAALVAGGWDADDAADIVETARQRTRDHRGVLTRDRIVRRANQHYRQATGRWYVGMPMLAAAWRLLHSLATLAALRRSSRTINLPARARPLAPDHTKVRPASPRPSPRR